MIQLVFFLILTLNLEGAVCKKVAQHGQRSTNYVLVRSQQLMHRLKNISYEEVRQVLCRPTTIGLFGAALTCCAIARLKRPAKAKAQELPQIQKNPERPQAVFPANVNQEASEEWRMASGLLGEIEAAGGLCEFILKGISNNEFRNAAVEAIQRSGLSEKETFDYGQEKYQFNEDELVKLVMLKEMITELIAPLRCDTGGSREVKQALNNLLAQLFYVVIGEGKTLILAYKVIIASDSPRLSALIKEFKEQLNYAPQNIPSNSIVQIRLIGDRSAKDLPLHHDDGDSDSDEERKSYDDENDNSEELPVIKKPSVISMQLVVERIIVHRNPQLFGHTTNHNNGIYKKIKSLAGLLEKEKTHMIWFLRMSAFSILRFSVRNLENGTSHTLYDCLNKIADTPWQTVLQKELEDVDFGGYSLDEVDAALKQLVAELRRTRTELTRLRAWGLRSN